MSKRRRNQQMRLSVRERMRATQQQDEFSSGVLVSNEFVPSVGVRRPVALGDIATRSVQRSLTRGLRAELGSKAKQYEVIDPAAWCLVLIEQGKMIEHIRRAQHRTPPQNMMRLAGALQTAFEDMRSDRSDDLTMPLGRPQSFSRRAVMSTIGIAPEGWRGHRAAYPSHGNREDNRLISKDIVDERELCASAISRYLGLGDEEAFDTLSATPRINVVRHKRGAAIPDHEYRRIENVLGTLMPDELPVGDPVIYLHHDRRSQPLVAHVPTEHHDFAELAA
jgi:hypothetical protein